MVHIYAIAVFACWAVFLLCWLILSSSTKRDAYRYKPGRRMLLSIAAVVGALVLYAGMFQHTWFETPFFSSAIWSLLGVVLCAIGIGFAIYARFALGTNWSAMVVIKENHELITHGPYSIVRHPIYTGVLLAILGSMLATDASMRGVLIVLIAIAGFTIKARKEEELMTREFPKVYPGYKKRTKMLIPWLL